MCMQCIQYAIQIQILISLLEFYLTVTCNESF